MEKPGPTPWSWSNLEYLKDFWIILIFLKMGFAHKPQKKKSIIKRFLKQISRYIADMNFRAVHLTVFPGLPTKRWLNYLHEEQLYLNSVLGTMAIQIAHKK